MKNPLNNILSFLVTSILIFMLAFIFMQFAIDSYKRSAEKLDEIKEIQEEKEEQLEEIIKELNP
jgi:hypothetical protein